MDVKSILFLTTQDIFGEVPNGGIQCSERNWKLLNEYLGRNNIYTGIIWNKNSDINCPDIKYFKRIKGGLEAGFSALFLSKTYLPSEYKKICRYVQDINPDILFLDSSLVGRVLKKINPNIIKIVFFHNVESEFAKHKMQKCGIQYFPFYLVSLFNEQAAVRFSDRIICLNNRDADLLKRLYKADTDLILPISFEDRFDENNVLCSNNEKKLLFIGSLFPPNYYGIKWFVDEVMGELTDFTLTIVGKGFEKKEKELSRENVAVIGTVDSLDEYYYKFAAVVMPILYGDGMKVKTAEAMMFGKTIFATDEALEGYDTQEIASGLYICNDRQSFIQKIRSAFDKNEIRPINRDVRNYFIEYHTNISQYEKMKKLLDGIHR